MRLQTKQTIAWLLAWILFAIPMALSAQEEEADETSVAEEEIENIIVVGTRNAAPRTTEDSTAPVDFISATDLSAIGNTADITDSLRSTVPYFNASMASGDGDTFVRSTSIRGLAPDQHLVMINGKRRHRAALIAEFVPAAGKGAHGPNIGMIPSIAIKNVQILRDGASAQYGGDAISGVMNFQMKDASNGGVIRTQVGSFYDGELTYKIDGNVGLQMGYDGFFTLSFEKNYNEAHSRGHQRPGALALIEAGVEGVGQDSPFGDLLVQTWGRPRHEGLLFFVNAGYQLSNTSEFYMHGNYADTHGRYRFFYRGPTHPTLRALAALDPPFTGLPQGFTPYFDGVQDDFSLYLGWRGFWNNGYSFDYSIGMGSNVIDFTLYNTINQSLGLNSEGQPLQRDFDVGDLEQNELTFNADFAKQMTETQHLAMGLEWRVEEFIIKPGEPVSYEGAGSSGFRGLEPRNAGSFDRQSYAAYAEWEYDIGRMLSQMAARFESFTDFGETLNGKVALRYRFDDRITTRMSVSTGFHAPTPGQINIQKVTTTFDTNVGGQVEQGLVASNSPLARFAGGKELQEETSINYSLGAVVKLDEVFDESQMTFDIYQIDINDRIYKTQTLPSVNPNTNIGTNISFYTNALDIQSRGFDIVYEVPFVFANIPSIISVAINRNIVEVQSQSLVNGVTPVPEADVEDIENSYPKLKLIMTSNTTISDNWDLMIRCNYYGKHYDERGRIGGTPPTKELGATYYFDIESRYQPNPSIKITAGVLNVFDTYVDEIKAPYANRQNVGLPYPRRTAANFEGGSFYARVEYSW